ncbi:MAG: LPS biosynthesis protein WbpP, partial [Candidatus Eisenbacteria bacterium]
VYNAARGGRKTLNELVETLSEIAGAEAGAVYGDPRPAEVRHSEASTERAEKELGFRAATSFEDGLARTFHWFKNQRLGQ